MQVSPLPLNSSSQPGMSQTEIQAIEYPVSTWILHHLHLMDFSSQVQDVNWNPGGDIWWALPKRVSVALSKYTNTQILTHTVVLMWSHYESELLCWETEPAEETFEKGVRAVSSIEVKNIFCLLSDTPIESALEPWGLPQSKPSDTPVTGMVWIGGWWWG